MLRNPRLELARLGRRKRLWDLERRAHRAELRHIRAMRRGDKRTAREAENVLLGVSKQLLAELRG